MSTEQIEVVYGGTARPAAESAVTRELRPNYDQANRIISFVHSWTIAGDILPGEGEVATTALLRQKLDALIAQFSVEGKRLQRRTTGGVIIDEIDPALCLSGPRLADISFASGADSVLPVRLPFSIRMEAIVRPSDLKGVDVLEFSETVTTNPEPHREWQGGRYFPGRLVPTRNFPGTVIRQQGRVLTLADRFVIPGPVLPTRYLLGAPQLSEPSIRPGKSGNQWRNNGLELSWSYDFVTPYPIYVRPHQWPGSTY